MEKNNHQGWYGESFIRVLASAAGLQVAEPTPDCTGVDFQISGTREVNGDFPLIAAQVKSWSAPLDRPGGWRYDRLTQKRFNALAGGNRRIPRFLFVVMVPRDTAAYARVDEHALQLSHAAYWVSLADREKISDAACERYVSVLVPKQNLLTAESLKALCEDGSSAGRRAS